MFYFGAMGARGGKKMKLKNKSARRVKSTSRPPQAQARYTHSVQEIYKRWAALKSDRSEFSMKRKRVQLCCLRFIFKSIFLAARETFRFHFSDNIFGSLLNSRHHDRRVTDRTSSQVFYAKMRNSIFHNFSHLAAWDSFWHACGGGLKNEKKKK